MISIGDLLYNSDSCLFGIITKKVDHAYPWIVIWNNGATNWVDTGTIMVWKKELKEALEK